VKTVGEKSRHDMDRYIKHNSAAKTKKEKERGKGFLEKGGEEIWFAQKDQQDGS